MENYLIPQITITIAPSSDTDGVWVPNHYDVWVNNYSPSVTGWSFSLYVKVDDTYVITDRDISNELNTMYFYQAEDITLYEGQTMYVWVYGDDGSSPYPTQLAYNELYIVPTQQWIATPAGIGITTGLSIAIAIIIGLVGWIVVRETRWYQKFTKKNRAQKKKKQGKRKPKASIKVKS